MQEYSSSTVYFEKPGHENTQRTLELVQKKASELGINTILIASTTGATGKSAVEMLKGISNIIVISHVAGFIEPNNQELIPENRQSIETSGAKILTAQHALGGVNRAIRQKVNTYQVDEIIANTLRIFGQGMKVALEISMMAADAGLLKSGEPIIAVGGTHRGADFAVVMNPANSFRFFDLRILEFICLPSPSHPIFSEK